MPFLFFDHNIVCQYVVYDEGLTTTTKMKCLQIHWLRWKYVNMQGMKEVFVSLLEWKRKEREGEGKREEKREEKREGKREDKGEDKRE